MFLKSSKIQILVIVTLLLISTTVNAIESHEIPSSYDLRDVQGHCYITPVKSQIVPGQWWNCVGICWACASLASFESSLLKQGIVKDPNSIEANLSPWHLGCHIGYNHPNYEFNDTLVGDPQVPISYQLDNTMQYGYGGSPLFTVDYLSTGRGLVLETQAPVPIEQMRARETLDRPEKNLPRHYMLRAGLVYERQDYGSDGEYRNAIKEALMEHGALSSMMYLCAPDFPGQNGHSYWRDDNYTDYYCDDPELMDNVVHAVTIAGWDDQREISGALGPGAWLIKDSMGTDFHDEGYLWISYHDTVFLKGHSYAVSFIADSGKGYSRQRYSTNSRTLSEPVAGESMYESDGYSALGRDSWCFARFIASGDDHLKAVGLITVNNEEEVTINIFGAWDEAENKPCGLLHREEIVLEEKGYHVIDLNRLVKLDIGQEFVIALGFRYSSRATREPLVYVTDAEPSSSDIRTYWASADGDTGLSGWKEYSEERENALLYIQGITLEGSSSGGCSIEAFHPRLLLCLVPLMWLRRK